MDNATYSELVAIMEQASEEVSKWPRWKKSPDVQAVLAKHGIVESSETGETESVTTPNPRMDELCERALGLLENSVNSLVELAEVFKEMRNLRPTLAVTTVDVAEKDVEEAVSEKPAPPQPIGAPMQRPARPRKDVP